MIASVITRVTPFTLLLITVLAPQPLAARQSGGVGPSFSYVEASGCEGLFLYTWNEARSEVLTIRVDGHGVKLVDGSTTFNLATAGEGVAVQVELTGARRGTMPYCSEAGQSSDGPPSIWIARAGILKIAFRRRANAPVTPVSVVLDNLVLASPEGTEIRSKRTIQFTAAVAGMTP
jgi:hypothetical protein